MLPKSCSPSLVPESDAWLSYASTSSSQLGIMKVLHSKSLSFLCSIFAYYFLDVLIQMVCVRRHVPLLRFGKGGRTGTCVDVVLGTRDSYARRWWSGGGVKWATGGGVCLDPLFVFVSQSEWETRNENWALMRSYVFVYGMRHLCLVSCLLLWDSVKEEKKEGEGETWNSRYAGFGERDCLIWDRLIRGEVVIEMRWMMCERGTDWQTWWLTSRISDRGACVCESVCNNLTLLSFVRRGIHSIDARRERKEHKSLICGFLGTLRCDHLKRGWIMVLMLRILQKKRKKNIMLYLPSFAMCEQTWGWMGLKNFWQDRKRREEYIAPWNRSFWQQVLRTWAGFKRVDFGRRRRRRERGSRTSISKSGLLDTNRCDNVRAISEH